MKILLLEYVTGGGLLAETPSGSLVAEGSLMLDALAEDWLEMPDVTVVIFQDRRLDNATRYTAHPRVEILRLASEREFQRTWQAQLADCDAVWPIAPESGGVLERLCREAEEAGTLLLNCPPEAVAVAASKAKTAGRLAARGVPAVSTQLLAKSMEPDRFPLVAKPDEGVGCLESRIIRSRTEWEDWLRSAPHAQRFDSALHQFDHRVSPRFVLQPLLEGEPSSLSAIFAHGQALLLSGNRQRVRETEGRFVFEGCSVNALRDTRSELQALATAVAAALPELWGYAGVDFVSAERGPVVLEVNPRLTTSYAGLRGALGINVARLVRELSGNGRLPHFTPPRGQCVEIVLEQVVDH